MQPTQQEPKQHTEITTTEPNFETKDFDGITFEVEEDEATPDGKIVKSRGVYLIPNTATTMAFACGFLSILWSTGGHFKASCFAIIAAGFLDGMDGRLARAFNAQSKFGEQYDSLSDLVNFGVAPAILMYSWALQPLGRLGIGAVFIFAVCAAWRLARFNVQVGTVDSRYFVGLASPLAAATMTSTVLVGIYHEDLLNLHSKVSQYCLGGLTVVVGFLMISNIRYWSFKQLNLKKVPFALLIPLLLLLILVSIDVPYGIFAICLTYIVAGFGVAVLRRLGVIKGI